MPESNAAQRERIARQVLAASRADQTEVLVSEDDAALTRFTHELCNQNVAASDTIVSVRAIVGNRTGVAQTNRLDDVSLNEVVARAIAMAKLAPQDPQQPSLPSGGPVAAPPGAYDEATANAGAGDRAALCGEMFDRAKSAGCWCAGFVSTRRSGLSVANSSGAIASFDGTDAGLNVKMNDSDSTGFGEAHAASLGRIDAVAAGRIAAEKARSSARPRSVEPGDWTVILEPAAFGELFAYLTDHFSAQSFDEGSSFCSDGLDRTYFSEAVRIEDDYAHPLSPGMPFDFEGQPTQRLALVDAGVVKTVVTDSYYAHKLQRPNTGHALPAPNAYGPQARNIVVGAGKKPAEQLVAETQRGLLVTRFWYIRPVDRKRATVTGMTRDGTFMIENGKVTGGVRNMRFNVGIVDVLKNCEFSNEQKRTGGYSYSLVVPTVKLDRFTFTSTTEF